MLIYTLDDPNYSIVLADNVLEHFKHHRQLKPKDKESGGQLFARFNDRQLLIKEVTGPRSSDKRSRHSYRPDRFAEQREIQEMFIKKFHYVGDWHTHPSSVPIASATDTTNMNSCVMRSDHELPGFLMIIVGTSSFPKGLHISMHTVNGETRLLNIKRSQEVNLN